MDAASAPSYPSASGQVDHNYVGVKAGRMTLKHTIMAKPKEVAILIAVLVAIIVLISAYSLYNSGKASAATKEGITSRNGHGVSTTNLHTGSNNPSWSAGNEQGQESTQPDLQSNPIFNGTGRASNDNASPDKPIFWDAGTYGDDLYKRGPAMTDEQIAAGIAAAKSAQINPLSRGSATRAYGYLSNTGGLSGMLGSACEMPSQEAEDDLTALQQVGSPIDTLGYGNNAWTAATPLYN